MPSTSKKQHNFMEAVAHNPSFAKKVGVPQSVGKDFSNADKGKFKRSIEMPIRPKDKSNDEMKKDVISNSVAERGYKKGGSVGTTKMGSVRTAAPSRDGVAVKGKTKGKMVTMKSGGKAYC